MTVAMASALVSFPSLFLQPKSAAVFKSQSSFRSKIKLIRQPSLLDRFSSQVTIESRVACDRPSSFKCLSQKQSVEEEVEQIKQEQVYVFERLFSNLNQATLKRESGSLSSSIFLVAGTTIGAGILAIPAVTQESGFLASAVTCILCWIFMVVTGLLIAEVNVKTMCELGSGGVSLVSMAKRTLGNAGVQIACWSYIFIHYALLVAYVARSSDILTNFLGIPFIIIADGRLQRCFRCSLVDCVHSEVSGLLEQ